MEYQMREDGTADVPSSLSLEYISVKAEEKGKNRSEPLFELRIRF